MANEASGRTGQAGSLPELIDLLYDAATAPERWRHFLEAAAGYFGAFGANFIRYHPQRPDRSLALLVGYETVPIQVRGEAMRALIISRDEDPRLRYSFEHPGKPFHCRQIMTTLELHASSAYQTLLKPHGVEYSMMITLPEEADAFAGLGLQRRDAAGSFADADVADLGELVPHLRRVLAIQDRLEHLDGRRRDTYAVLESLPTGILILAADGMIEFANAAARDLLDRCDGLSAEQGALRAYRRSGLDLLEPVLREVMASGEYRAMAVERPSGRPAFRCLLSRLWRDVGDGLPNLLASPRIACYVTDPDRALEAPAELLQRLFGLTPGEARLVEAIVSGSSLAEAAESLGIRESTARDRLKGVFRKTATGSQTELVRTVLTSPVWLCGGGGVPPPLTLGD